MNRIKNPKPQRPPNGNSGNSVNSVSKTQALVSALLAWFATNARDLPWRRTRDPYAIWVSEIMLQQTQVKTVIPYWVRWMRELPTIQSAAKASPAKLHKLWEGLGYYTRVRNLQKAAQQIITLSRSRRREEVEISPTTKPSASSPRRLPEYEFPQTFADILALSGVGRYTAGAIASIAFNQPKPILDGNVIRVLTRIFGITTNPREKLTNAQLWQLAEELVKAASEHKNSAPNQQRPTLLPLPGERAGVRAVIQPKTQNACSHLNQSLMELGALICTPRAPNCATCPVSKLCIARKQNLQEQLPNLGKREAATARRFIAFVVEHNGKFLVRQRPADIVNAHLWEFPNQETQSRKPVGDFRQTSTKPFCIIKHSITRYRITLEAWRAELGDDSAKAPGRWLTLKQLHKLAFTSAHKKILSRLETLNS